MTVPSVGLRELRQQASELVRRAQAGETVTVTVSGRPAARLVPVGRGSWRRVDDLSAFFAGPSINEEQWRADLAAFDGSLRDPWGDR